MRYFLTLLLTVFLSIPALAGNVEVMSDGSMRIIDNELVVVERPDITVSPEAMVYSEEWKKAIRSPDVLIEVGYGVPSREPAGFNVRMVTETTNVVYDTKRKEVSVVNTSTSTEKFNIFYVLVGVSVLLVVVTFAPSDSSFNIFEIAFALVIAFTLTIVAAFVAFITSAPVAAAFTVLTAAALRWLMFRWFAGSALSIASVLMYVGV